MFVISYSGFKPQKDLVFNWHFWVDVVDVAAEFVHRHLFYLLHSGRIKNPPCYHGITVDQSCRAVE